MLAWQREWAVQGLNLWPPACDAGALPAELTARCFYMPNMPVKAGFCPVLREYLSRNYLGRLAAGASCSESKRCASKRLAARQATMAALSVQSWGGGRKRGICCCARVC